MWGQSVYIDIGSHANGGEQQPGVGERVTLLLECRLLLGYSISRLAMQ